MRALPVHPLLGSILWFCDDLFVGINWSLPLFLFHSMFSIVCRVTWVLCKNEAVATRMIAYLDSIGVVTSLSKYGITPSWKVKMNCDENWGINKTRSYNIKQFAETIDARFPVLSRGLSQLSAGTVGLKRSHHQRSSRGASLWAMKWRINGTSLSVLGSNIDATILSFFVASNPIHWGKVHGRETHKVGYCTAPEAGSLGSE